MAKRKWSTDEKMGCGIAIVFALIGFAMAGLIGVGVWAFIEIVQWLTSK